MEFTVDLMKCFTSKAKVNNFISNAVFCRNNEMNELNLQSITLPSCFIAHQQFYVLIFNYMKRQMCTLTAVLSLNLLLLYVKIP